MVIPSYIPAYHYGGPIRSVAALSEALVREGHEVRVLTTNANGRTKLDIETNTVHIMNGVEVIYYNRWTGDHSNFSPALLIGLWRIVKKYDAIHLHAWWNLVTIPSVFICLLNKIRPIISPRGSVTSYSFDHRNQSVKRWIHYSIGQKLLQKCLIHVTSDQEAIDVKQFIPTATIKELPNLIDLPTKHDILNESAETLRLIYVGRIDPKKNIEFLLEVLLHPFEVPFTLNIIGEGEKTYLDKLKKITLENDNIKWVGPIYDNRKFKWLAESDILMMPSINENYGNVILEALSQGTAVLVSNTVGLKDYIIKHQLGWVVPLSVVEWRIALRQVWADKSCLFRIRRVAASLITMDFNQSSLVKQYIAMYSIPKGMNNFKPSTVA